MSFILKGNNIEIAAPVYSHDNSRYHVRNHFFFATKHSTWLLFVNTQLGLHHITCFKLIHRNPQNGQFGCSSCAAMLSFPSVDCCFSLDSRNPYGWYPLKMHQITRASSAELRTIVRAIWRSIGYTTICASNRYILDKIKTIPPLWYSGKWKD